MLTVHKFPIPRDKHTVARHMIDPSARPLAARMQGDSICVWMLVDSEAEKVEWWLKFFGTGWEVSFEDVPVSDAFACLMKDDGSGRGRFLADECHVDTVVDGSFVWHVFAGRAVKK